MVEPTHLKNSSKWFKLPQPFGVIFFFKKWSCHHYSAKCDGRQFSPSFWSRGLNLCLFPPALRWRNLSLEIDPSTVGFFFENIRGFEKKLGGLSGEFTTPSTARTTSARPGRVEIGPPAPSPQKSPQKPGGNQCLIRPYFWRVGLPLGGRSYVVLNRLWICGDVCCFSIDSWPVAGPDGSRHIPNVGILLWVY